MPASMKGNGMDKSWKCSRSTIKVRIGGRSSSIRKLRGTCGMKEDHCHYFFLKKVFASAEAHTKVLKYCVYSALLQGMKDRVNI